MSSIITIGINIDVNTVTDEDMGAQINADFDKDINTNIKKPYGLHNSTTTSLLIFYKFSKNLQK